MSRRTRARRGFLTRGPGTAFGRKLIAAAQEMVQIERGEIPAGRITEVTTDAEGRPVWRAIDPAVYQAEVRARWLARQAAAGAR